MKTFTIENETNNIIAHATKQEAALVSNAEIFSSDTDLAELGANWPAPRLIEIWNSIPGNTPVKKFTDRKTAATRIWKAIQSLGDSIPAETATEPAQTEASPDMQSSEEAPLPESEQVEVETPASEPDAFGDGTCRLMPRLVERLAETSRTWQTEAQSIAEWYAQAVCSSSRKALRGPGTRLTHRSWFESRSLSQKKQPKPAERQNACKTCGGVISRRTTYCTSCADLARSEALKQISDVGRVAAHSRDAQASRRANSSRNNQALLAWDASEIPEWLTREFYANQIQPRLRGYSRPVISEKLAVALNYAGSIRKGAVVPHQRHWKPLADLVGVAETKEEQGIHTGRLKFFMPAADYKSC